MTITTMMLQTRKMIRTSGRGLAAALLAAGAIAGLGLTAGFGVGVERAETAAGAAEAAQSETNAQTFKIDPVHSTVVFGIDHLGVAKFYGRFNTISGSFVIDRDNPSNSSIAVEIQADSVDTNNDGRDRHLKGPDFFDAKQFPTITFESTKIERAGTDKWNVTGDVTLHGVTKPMTATVDITGMRDTGRQGYKAGLATTFTVTRSEFGMTKYIAEGALGDEVTLMVGLEGARQ